MIADGIRHQSEPQCFYPGLYFNGRRVPKSFFTAQPVDPLGFGALDTRYSYSAVSRGTHFPSGRTASSKRTLHNRSASMSTRFPVARRSRVISHPRFDARPCAQALEPRRLLAAVQVADLNTTPAHSDPASI